MSAVAFILILMMTCYVHHKNCIPHVPLVLSLLLGCVAYVAVKPFWLHCRVNWFALPRPSPFKGKLFLVVIDCSRGKQCCKQVHQTCVRPMLAEAGILQTTVFVQDAQELFDTGQQLKLDGFSAILIVGMEVEVSCKGARDRAWSCLPLTDLGQL